MPFLPQEPVCLWPQPCDWSLHWLHPLLQRLPHGGPQVPLIRGLPGQTHVPTFTENNATRPQINWFLTAGEIVCAKIYLYLLFASHYANLSPLSRLVTASRVTLTGAAALCWVTAPPSTAPGPGTRSRCISTQTPRPRNKIIYEQFKLIDFKMSSSSFRDGS